MDQRNRLYVAIDSLVDLRQGVLTMVSPEFAVDVTTKEGYFQREEDSFNSDLINPKYGQPYGRISSAQVHELITHCGKRVLQASLRTKIGKFLKQLCAIHFNEMIKEGWEMSVEIDINLHPYEYTQDEINELYDAITVYLGKTFKFNLINVSPKDMTLEKVRDVYFGMVMYTYHEWVNLHDTELKKKPLRDTCLYVPRMFFGDLDSVQNKTTARAEIAELRKKNNDPFDMFRQALGPFISIQYLPVAFYCADVPENLSKYTDPVKG